MDFSLLIKAIIYLLLTICLFKGVTIGEYYGTRLQQKHPIQIWMIFIAGLMYLLPILGLMGFCSVCILFTLFSCREHEHGYHTYIEVPEPNIVQKICISIGKFFIKEL